MPHKVLPVFHELKLAGKMAATKEQEKELKKKAREKRQDNSAKFYARNPEEVLKEFSSDSDQGLTDEEVQKRREKYGENKLPEKKRVSAITLFFKQFKDFLIYILFIAAGISLYIGHMTDVYIILVVILFNAIMGFTQEYKAEKAIEAIKSMIVEHALVLRNGEKKEIKALELVPGDIIVLEEGQTVPADARLVEMKNLQASEASLTGESEPVEKQLESLEDDTVLADRVNMVWKSTHIVKGKGRAVVTATGKQTEIGKIAQTLGEMKKTDSNFRKKTARLAKIMAYISIATSAVVFAIGYFIRSYEFQDILMITIATLVSSIPEGLPVVISIVLAIGASRMAKRNAIIREFTATEELGSVTTILSDKTGTITQGVLSIRKITGGDDNEWEVTGQGYEAEGKVKEDGKDVAEITEEKVLSKILTIAAFCNSATWKREGKNDEEEAGDSSDGQKNKNNEKHDDDIEGNVNEKRQPGDSEESLKRTSADERRVKESRRRITEDLRRLEEDIRDFEYDESGYKKIVEKDRQQLHQTIDRWQEDVERHVTQHRPAGGGEDERKESTQPNDEKDKKASDEIKVSGDPTEVALLVLAKKTGIKDQSPFNKVRILDEIPFSSDQKFRASLVQYNNTTEMLVVGAPEKILSLSAQVFTEKGPKKADKKEKDKIGVKHDEWADQAMRIIALAHKPFPQSKKDIKPDDVKDLVWTGMVGIIDPPREEVKEAVEACKHAGIRVMMVTGDHKKTAAAIARNVGIVDSNQQKNGKFPLAVSEKDIADLDDKAFDEIVKNVSVFARVSPNSKLRIAERLHASGELIAMTGDGVNDALALKKADVGIAMGKRGTDVAKDASQIVLSDDNFASIVNAIREGRIIFNNVKIVSYFLLTTNFAMIVTIITALLLGMPMPLTAVQILWVNMVTDGVMDVGLATEPGHGDIMERKPIKKDESILKWEVMPNLAIISVIMVVLTLGTYNYYLPQGETLARTAAFLAISMTQIFNVFNMRDLKESVFKIGMFSNKWINLAFVASFVLQLAVIEIPFFRKLFNFEDIGLVPFLIITAISTVVLWAGEAHKLIQRRMKRREG